MTDSSITTEARFAKPDIDDMLRRALGLCKGNAEEAAALFQRWAESDSAIRDVQNKFMRELIAGYILDIKEQSVAD